MTETTSVAQAAPPPAPTASAAGIRELPLEPGGTVEIHLSSSDLQIRGTDGDRVIFRTRDGRAVADEFSIDATANRVSIRDNQSGLRLGSLFFRVRGAPDLDIDIPRSTTVQVRTLSGDVVAEGIGGPSHWTSASGDLRVGVSAGPVAIETMSGDAALDAVTPIALTVRTVSGDLSVRAPRLDLLNASSTSGDVQVQADLAAGVAHSVSSVSGDVEIATASPVRVETQSIAGDVRVSGIHRSEGGRGRRTVVVGDGSARVSVRTTSGDVRLRALGPGAIAQPAPAQPAPTQPAPTQPAPTQPAPQAPVVPAAESALPVVAEAEAAPNLVRRDAQPQPAAEAQSGAPSAVDDREQARLDVLRALERGELDVESASLRLEGLEESGPSASQGWS